MKLTGKCKEAFDKWFKATYCFMGNMQREGQQFETDEQFISKFEHFNISPSSMQYGVYVDFSETVEEITKHKMAEGEQSYIDGGHTRPEARTFTVAKFDKRFNAQG